VVRDFLNRDFTEVTVSRCKHFRLWNRSELTEIGIIYYLSASYALVYTVADKQERIHREDSRISDSWSHVLYLQYGSSRPDAFERGSGMSIFDTIADDRRIRTYHLFIENCVGGSSGSHMAPTRVWLVWMVRLSWSMRMNVMMSPYLPKCRFILLLVWGLADL
jgi:hypothetical protein